MSFEITNELLERELPELPEDLAVGESVGAWVTEAAALINELRGQLAATASGTADEFNQMVRLGTQAADAIVANAHGEAARIVERAQEHSVVAATAADSEDTETVATSDSTDGEGSFNEEWEQGATIDERIADRAFFETGFEEPSRSWILADAG